MNFKKRHINKFVKLANELDLLMKEIQIYCPNANYYVTVDTLNLMKGETHNSNDFIQSAIRENVVEDVHIGSLGGGDW